MPDDRRWVTDVSGGDRGALKSPASSPLIGMAMNVPAILSIVAAMTGLAMAVLAWRISKAPLCGDKRFFSLVALCAAGYAVCDVLSFVDISDAALVAVMRVQGTLATAHAGCWFTYTYARLGLPRTRAATIALVVCGVLSVLWLVPGCMLTNEIQQYDIAWVGARYRLQTTTAPGTLLLVLDCIVLVVPVALYVRARRRVSGALLHAAGLAGILLSGIYDTLVAIVPFPSPFILPLGFFISITAVGVSFATAFVDSARKLDTLTKHLEHLVEERTRKMLDAEFALARSERLAAIGKLSAGVAHEINNPAAAVAANLEHLRSALAKGGLPHDAAECLDDSYLAVQRIAAIVRQLLDSTRAEASPEMGTVSVARATQQALATVRSQLDERVQVEVDVPARMYVRGDESSLVQVLVNLLVNGAQAIPDGQERAVVRVTAREHAGRISVEVEDNGAGIPEHVRARLFEPFFTTKPLGKGTGLGLSVSLGLVRSMGGEIEVDTAPGHTTMRVLVPISRAA